MKDLKGKIVLVNSRLIAQYNISALAANGLSFHRLLEVVVAWDVSSVCASRKVIIKRCPFVCFAVSTELATSSFANSNIFNL